MEARLSNGKPPSCDMRKGPIEKALQFTLSKTKTALYQGDEISLKKNQTYTHLSAYQDLNQKSDLSCSENSSIFGLCY